MKAQIDKEGWLSVERAGRMKAMYCPWTMPETGAAAHCGDSCPLFYQHEGRNNIALACTAEWVQLEVVSDERRAKEQVTP